LSELESLPGISAAINPLVKKQESTYVQIFPPKILTLFLEELGLAIAISGSIIGLYSSKHYQATSCIFSSISVSTCSRLNALLDILNANPNIARRTRSFTVVIETFTESLPANYVIYRTLDSLLPRMHACSSLSLHTSSAISAISASPFDGILSSPNYPVLKNS